MHIINIKWEKPIRKGYILYDPNYVTWEKAKYGDSKKIRCAGGESDEQEDHRRTSGQWTYSACHRMVGTCH